LQNFPVIGKSIPQIATQGILRNDSKNALFYGNLKEPLDGQAATAHAARTGFGGLNL